MKNRLVPRWRGCAVFVLMGGLALCGIYLSTSIWPSIGAQGADMLRSVLGDETVAQMEMVLFQAQDTLEQWQNDLGLIKPASPWQAAAAQNDAAEATPIATLQNKGSTFTASQTSDTTATAAPPRNETAASATPAPSPTEAAWTPAPLHPLGNLAGEGIWSAYLQDPSGRVVAYRTFLQPDPKRPYAVVAVVAFDMKHTRLHYVLGSIEPLSPDGPKRSGKIPNADLIPGRLLATFNGGFKATHGHFGAMADGVTALPPKDGIGTLAIYANGSLRIGEWGSDISSSPDMLDYRQNGPLVIHDGQIDPEIYSNSPKDWGYTVNDVSPTLRSGLGLSTGGNTLYYFAGPRLSMEALAKSMQDAGAYQGMQLDINNFWVLFVAIHADGSKLIPEPLLPDQMKEFLDRYLHPYTRDYFYITVGG